MFFPTEPSDYISHRVTLTFPAEADGSQPSDAVCTNVPIIDDPEPEETEYLIFHIAALDDSLIRVEDANSQKILYIEDNDGIIVICIVICTKYEIKI